MKRQVFAAATLFCVACSSNPASQGPDDSASFSGIHSAAVPGSAGGTITREDIERMRFTRIEDYIASRVPGVQVIRHNGGVSFQIRGPNTILGNSEPLIVLDGVPLLQGTGGLSSLNISPSDVERIDVLKDAGSSAIYGSRGANGVILIRTRLR